MVDENYLRKLLASGQITQEQLSQMPISGGVPNMLAQAMQGGGEMGGRDSNLYDAVPGQGFQGLQSGQGVIQQTNEDGSQFAPIRIDSQPRQRMPERDMTRNAVDLPGGRGYYGKDGQVYNANGSLYLTPETQARNQAMSMAEQDRQMKMAEMQARTSKLEAETLNLNAKPTGPKGQIVDGQWVEFGADGKPSASAIPGLTPKEKPSTEDEKKSAGYGIRMENSLRIMNQLGKDNPGDVKPGVMATMAGGIPLVGGMLENTINSSPRRQIEAAQLDALDAALTLATGAAYTKEQLAGARKGYFPQIGDTPADVEMKKNQLDTLIQTARIRAGNSAGNIDKVLGPRPPSGASAAAPSTGRLPNAIAVSEAKNNPALRGEFIRTFGPQVAAQYGIQ